MWHSCGRTPNIAFRHLPPDSASFGYATEGALFISTQLSTDAVSAFYVFAECPQMLKSIIIKDNSAVRKVWVLVRLWKQPSAHART